MKEPEKIFVEMEQIWLTNDLKQNFLALCVAVRCSGHLMMLVRHLLGPDLALDDACSDTAFTLSCDGIGS